MAIHIEIKQFDWQGIGYMTTTPYIHRMCAACKIEQIWFLIRTRPASLYIQCVYTPYTYTLYITVNSLCQFLLWLCQILLKFWQIILRLTVRANPQCTWYAPNLLHGRRFCLIELNSVHKRRTRHPLWVTFGARALGAITACMLVPHQC